MRFMAYLVSALAAFLVPIFLLANWMFIHLPYGNKAIDVSGIYLIFQSVKTGAVGGYVLLLILFFALCIFIVSLIPKITLRRVLISTFGVFALCALFYFAAIGGDPTARREELSLGMGWYGTMLAVIVAMIGAFIPKAKIDS
jgi:drug/metabolite transporter superfamily protein YnfA